MWYHQETSPLQKNLPRTTANSSNAYNTIARHTLHHSYEPATSIKNKENCQSSINQSREYTNHWKHSLGNQPTLYYLLPHLTKPMCIFLIPNLIQNTEKTRSVKVPINQCMTMVHEKKKECNFCLPKPNNSHCTIIVIPSWATEPKIKATLCTFNSTKVSNAYQKSLCTFNINDSNQTYEIMKSTYPLRRRQKLQRLYGLMVSIRQEALTGINIFRTIWYHHHTDISFNDT